MSKRSCARCGHAEGWHRNWSMTMRDMCHAFGCLCRTFRERESRAAVLRKMPELQYNGYCKEPRHNVPAMFREGMTRKGIARKLGLTIMEVDKRIRRAMGRRSK